MAINEIDTNLLYLHMSSNFYFKVGWICKFTQIIDFHGIFDIYADVKIPPILKICCKLRVRKVEDTWYNEEILFPSEITDPM